MYKDAPARPTVIILSKSFSINWLIAVQATINSNEHTTYLAICEDNRLKGIILRAMIHCEIETENSATTVAIAAP